MVETPLADAVVLKSPLAQGFAADAVLCQVETTSYGLRQLAGGGARLVRLTGVGAEQPLVDNVAAFELAVDDPDAALMRRVTLRLRVQAGSADLRGPAGYLFTNAGTADTARRWLPDVELRADVALRNGRAPW